MIVSVKAYLGAALAAVASGVVILGPGATAQPLASSQDTRPNVLFIMVEDLSPRIGAFGDETAQTPNLDRLAAGGIRYTNVFTTAGVCSPSRGALFSGRYQQSIGAQHMRTSSFGNELTGALGTFSTDGHPYETVPPADVKAFPERIRAQGYYTYVSWKTDHQFGEPFTMWDARDEAGHWRDRAPGQPFFAMYGSSLSHESSLFREETATGSETGPYRARLIAAEHATLDSRTDPAVVPVPGYLPDTPIIRRDIAQHYDNIRLMDRYVGTVLDQLETEGVADNTIIVWTTDHGDGLPGAKRSLYDRGLHVPMIVRYPDERGAGQVDDRLISFVDLTATLLALTGAPSGPTVGDHGRDFLGTEDPVRDYVFAARDRIDEHPDRVRAVRDDRYKYIRNFMPERAFFAPVYYRENIEGMQELRRLHAAGTLDPRIGALFETPRPAEELYDTKADPFELDNLANDEGQAETKGRLREALDVFLATYPDYGTISEALMVEQMWPGGEQPVTAAPHLMVEEQAGQTAGQIMVTMTSETEGASIGYREAPAGPWRLYTGPVALPAEGTIEAKAIRYGFAESDIVSQGRPYLPQRD